MNFENLTGQTLGQYQLRELLGVGGMGAVYRGYQATLKRDVAVKVLPSSFSGQSGYIERFNREAQTVATLEHAHIVPIYDFGTKNRTMFVVMRLLTGGTLSQRLEQRAGQSHPLPSFGEIARVLNELASALDYAHSLGVIHRDIKASNVMFDSQGASYLVDFGIARLAANANTLTNTGMTMGTPSYMSPEQWRGEEVTPAADQYGLGVLAFVLVSGHLPFEADTPYALMHKHLHEMPTPSYAWRTDIPDAITKVIERALAKNPRDRFPTVSAFAQAFENAVGEYAGKPTDFFTVKVKTHQINASSETPVSYSKSYLNIRFRARQPITWAVGVLILFLFGLALLFALKPPETGREINFTLTYSTQSTMDVTAAFTQNGNIIVVLPTLSPTTDLSTLGSISDTPSSTTTPFATSKITITPTVLEPTYTLIPSLTETISPSATLTSTATLTPIPVSTNTVTAISTLAPVTITPSPVNSIPLNSTVTTTLAPSLTATNTIAPTAFVPPVLDSLKPMIPGFSSPIVLARTLDGYNGSVNSVTFNPVSNILASAGDDGSIHFWDPLTDRILPTLHVGSGSIYSIVFSPDGKLLASAHADGSVILWDVGTGQILRMMKGHTSAVLSLAFSPNGLWLASSSNDQTIRVWNVSLGETERILSGHNSSVHSVAFSPDGTLLASYSDDGNVWLWDYETGNILQKFRPCSDTSVCNHTKGPIVFSPDNKLIAVGTNLPWAWDLSTGKVVLSGGYNRLLYTMIISLSIQDSSGNQAYLYVDGGEGGSLAFGKITVSSATASQGEEKLLNSPFNSTGTVLSLAFNSDWKLLASSGTDGIVRVWRLAHPTGCSVTSEQTIRMRSGPDTHFAVYQTLLAGDHKSVFFQVKSGKDTWLGIDNDAWVRSDLVHTIGSCDSMPDWNEPQPINTSSQTAIPETPTAFFSNPSTQQIAFEVAEDGKNHIYVINSDGSNLRRVAGSFAFGTSPVWSPDGQDLLFAAGSAWNDLSINVIHINEELPVQLTASMGIVSGLAWSPDGRQIAFTAGGSPDKSQLYIMDANTKNLRQIKLNNDKMSLQLSFPVLCWSPDGSRIAFTGMDSREKAIHLYTVDVSSNDLHLISTNTVELPTSPRWLPDGSHIGIFGYPNIGEIYEVNVVTDEVRQLTLDNGGADMEPDWSSDGKKIVFESLRTNNNDYDLYVMNSDGSEKQPIAPSSFYDILPIWSPDNSKIAFASSRDGGFRIYLVQPDGNNIRQLTPNTQYSRIYRITWQPTRVSGTENQFPEVIALSTPLIITSTPVPTPTASTIATVTVSISSANLRSGPGANFPVVGNASYRANLKVIAQAYDNAWYLVEQEDGRFAWISDSVVAVSAQGVIEPAATIPAAPIVQVSPIPTSGKPVISKAYTEGTCSSHYYVVVWNDPDGDAIRIDYLNQSDSSIFGSGSLSGTGGEYHTETYTGCSSSVCGLNFVVTDQAGNRSNIKGGEIHCS